MYCFILFYILESQLEKSLSEKYICSLKKEQIVLDIAIMIGIHGLHAKLANSGLYFGHQKDRAIFVVLPKLL